MTSLLMRAQSGDYKRNIILCRELCQGWLDCQGEIVDQDWHSLLQKVGFMSSPPPVLCWPEFSGGASLSQWRCLNTARLLFRWYGELRLRIIIVNSASSLTRSRQKIITQYVVMKIKFNVKLFSDLIRSEKWGDGICRSWPRSLGSAAVTQNNHICPLMGIELPSTDQKRITRHRMAVRSQSSLPQLNELAEYIGDEI